ncbi:S-layer homology domain-containing protein [Paenibacillus sp. MWE-103]|uniref:S-layer homology domain-containing protein n=1 Tax=Paenibacillus artemisiicola TaxID=1172618 RepID=A0ABS3WCY5_9BACL|nr:S-layer homology domain-containing protein [Paenibacillus artemisiicola]MBO7746167.1 S-layer homology domain-containing protein [Paenibacillus artemisiicola]
MKKSFKMLTLTATAALSLTFASQSFAAAGFTDLGNDAAKDKIISLQERGLVKGVSAELFAPQASMTAAQGVQLIVNALDLNLDLVRFFKEPKASDYFQNAKDDAWYADAFIIAAVNNIGLPADLNPGKVLSREEFTHMLIHAMEASGKLPMVNPVVIDIKDGDQITVDYSGSIQRALSYGVIALDKDGQLKPKAAITRSESAEEIYNAIEYLKAHPGEVADGTLTAAQGADLIGGALGAKAELGEDVAPDAVLTREAFIDLLVRSVEKAGQLPLINPVVVDIKDQDQINVVYSGSIQRAIKYGIVQLNEDGTFGPKTEVTRSAALEAIDKATAYLKAHQAPAEANAPITAAQGADLIAKQFGIAVDLKSFDLNPDQKATREAFTHVLVQSLQKSGKLPMIKVAPVDIKDGDQLDALYSGSVQTALNLGIVKLDADGKFDPKAELTQAQAADEIANAVKALDKYPQAK